jgi:hypothetical protein
MGVALQTQWLQELCKHKHVKHLTWWSQHHDSQRSGQVRSGQTVTGHCCCAVGKVSQGPMRMVSSARPMLGRTSLVIADHSKAGFQGKPPCLPVTPPATHSGVPAGDGGCSQRQDKQRSDKQQMLPRHACVCEKVVEAWLEAGRTESPPPLFDVSAYSLG